VRVPFTLGFKPVEVLVTPPVDAAVESVSATQTEDRKKIPIRTDMANMATRVSLFIAADTSAYKHLQSISILGTECHFACQDCASRCIILKVGSSVGETRYLGGEYNEETYHVDCGDDDLRMCDVPAGLQQWCVPDAGPGACADLSGHCSAACSLVAVLGARLVWWPRPWSEMEIG
jgi:hypothetical protein